jgi:hypothetical protein
VSRFPEMSKNVDHFAAGGVALVGDVFPQTAGEIITGVTTPAKQTIFTIQSTIDTKVTTPINHQARKIATQVCEQITPIARNVDKSLEPFINTYDGIVHRLLPAEESETEEERGVDSYQTYRAYSLTSKAQRRLSRRLKRQITNTQSFTSTQLRQLQESSALLRQATDSVATLNSKLNELVSTAKTNAVSLRDTVQNQDVATTLQGLSKNLLATTDSIAKYIKENAGQLPEYFHASLDPLVTFFNGMYEDVVKEIRKDDANTLQKAKDIVNVTSQHTLPVLQQSLTNLSTSLESYRSTFNGTLASTTEAARGYLASNKPVGVN